MSVNSSQENLAFSKLQLLDNGINLNEIYTKTEYYQNYCMPDCSETCSNMPVNNEFFNSIIIDAKLPSTCSYFQNTNYSNLNFVPVYDMLPDFQGVLFTQPPETATFLQNVSTQNNATPAKNPSKQPSPASQVPTSSVTQTPSPKTNQTTNSHFQRAPESFKKGLLTSLESIQFDSNPPKRRKLVRRTKFNESQVCWNFLIFL